MGDFFKALFARFPDWFFVVASILILIGLIGLLVWFMLGAKRFSDAMGRENRLIALQEDFATLKQENKDNTDLASQLGTVLVNVQSYVSAITSVRQTTDVNQIFFEVNSLIQRMVEALASDVKYVAGERHRCGLWLQEQDQLVLVFASAGFPREYLRNRRLDLDRSIAGRSFRRNQTIKRDNVFEDDDWEINPNSSSTFKAIICIPISNWAILTIDALQPMRNETVLIGELYGRLIENVMMEYTIALSRQYAESEAEAAATNEADTTEQHPENNEE